MRSELQDICDDYGETSNFLIHTDRVFSMNERTSVGSRQTVRPPSNSRPGLSSKVAKMLNQTHAVDPELASLIGGTAPSECKTDR